MAHLVFELVQRVFLKMAFGIVSSKVPGKVPHVKSHQCLLDIEYDEFGNCEFIHFPMHEVVICY